MKILEEHWMRECVAIVPCNLCGAEMPSNHHSAHELTECPKATVLCTVNFGVWYKCTHECRREELADHMADEEALATHEELRQKWYAYIGGQDVDVHVLEVPMPFFANDGVDDD